MGSNHLKTSLDVVAYMASLSKRGTVNNATDQISDSDWEKPPRHGCLPAWEVDDLPEPLPFSFANALRTIGPGAILLAASIGGGEWLAGPAMVVRYGHSILWIVTTAILLQLIFNLEGIRYTLYTGEPILTGFLRLRPGPVWWATIYILLGFAQLSVPALASGCANVLFSAWTGSVPDESDSQSLLWITYGVILFGVVILLSGKTVERTLERASWFMIVFIMVFLTITNLIFVPMGHWYRTFLGFFRFGSMPSDVNVMLLATFAATAGSGGLGNLVISNWVRDKGFGMGAKVGAIGGAFASHGPELAHIGKVFPLTNENRERWRTWWRYVSLDQVWLWGLGCFLGMYFNVNLASYLVPAGTDLTKIGAGAYQAKYMAEQLWSGFWILGLLNGFWILFSTHLGNTDTLVRTITDMLWVSNSRIRGWKRGKSSRLYYSLLAAFTVWGMIAVNWGTAMQLFTILGVVAGPVLTLGAIQILRVNTTLLPPELRPSWWRRAALILCAIFYGVLSAATVWSKLQ
jgi:hypothetical protein